MARPDRDQEINLYFNLMSNTEATQYDIMPNPMPGLYGQPYDLGSIMHYFPTVNPSISGKKLLDRCEFLECDVCTG